MCPNVKCLSFCTRNCATPVISLRLRCVSPLAMGSVTIIRAQCVSAMTTGLYFRCVVHGRDGKRLITGNYSIRIFISGRKGVYLGPPTFFRR